MKETRIEHKLDLSGLIYQAQIANLEPLGKFFSDDPTVPLIATGSGGAESVANFASLLYGARYGFSSPVTPYTLNSYSDDALATAKVLLVSASGHNDDIVHAAKRCLAVAPNRVASYTFCPNSERNKVRELFRKAGNSHSIDIPFLKRHPDGFVSIQTPIEYFAQLVRVFQPDVDLDKYSSAPATPFRTLYNDGSELAIDDLKSVKNFVILSGSWGRPVADNLEGKFVESGSVSASFYDYRNYCHGRFIYTSNHLEDSAVILLVTPRERDIVERTRKYLPSKTKLVIIETEADAPEASLDLLIKSTYFFFDYCDLTGTDHNCPSNPGRIDKRVPMWIPFVAAMKKSGPLTITKYIISSKSLEIIKQLIA